MCLGIKSMYRYLLAVDNIVGVKLKCKHMDNLGLLKQMTKVLHDVFAELHRYSAVLK